MCSLEIEKTKLLCRKNCITETQESVVRYRSTVSGSNIEEAIPDPIPNSEVKLLGADGTARGICVGE